ncbi:hypothetical protein OHA84_02705 [Streptomyces sp. NBC_00513]|uniref:hypothetical protein n=1 Tax=unclassified Streptomyces TaxID=2593676 RepID=UPI00224CD5C6|nr:hypothetical protein [Streptomyces sp. NBC_00424]MCX5077545.1 hypothetical protein [Streptomyces sp. NBC_00424]WUD39480.1 hypothetical protein OHA84_02705 [Streptomyces sp. NBC_00513]
MPDSNDPLRSLFQEAASAGQEGTALAPVSVIARRGERARRRRIAGLAVAACLVVAGSGAAVAGLLPDGGSGNLPATTPSPLLTPSPSSAPPPSSTPTPPPSSSATSSRRPSPPPTARTTDPVLPNATVPPPTGGSTVAPSSTAPR